MSHMSPASLRVSLNASLATPLSVSLAFALAGNLALTAVMPAHAQTTIVSPKNNLSVTEMEELYVSGRVVINPTLSTAIRIAAKYRPLASPAAPDWLVPQPPRTFCALPRSPPST